MTDDTAFSSPGLALAQTYERMLPQETDLRVLAYDASALKDFLGSNIGVLEAVWFDVAGPHAMRPTPHDVLDALELKADE